MVTLESDCLRSTGSEKWTNGTIWLHSEPGWMVIRSFWQCFRAESEKLIWLEWIVLWAIDANKKNILLNLEKYHSSKKIPTLLETSEINIFSAKGKMSLIQAKRRVQRLSRPCICMPKGGTPFTVGIINLCTLPIIWLIHHFLAWLHFNQVCEVLCLMECEHFALFDLYAELFFKCVRC